MRSAVATALLAGLIAGSAPRDVHAQEDTRAVLERCAREGAQQRRSLEQIAGACPGLGAALDAMGLTDTLTEDSAARLDADALLELAALMRDRSGTGPDPARLAPLLRDLRGSDAPESWWQRLKGWLVSVMTGPGPQRSFSWLDSWLQRLTPGELLRQVLIYGAMAAVVIAALVVALRELRAANPGLRRSHRRTAAPTVIATDGEETLADLEALPLADRPRRVFRHVAARLVAAGRLPALRSLTHRELQQRALLDDAAQRHAWQELARLAERQLYAARGAEDAAITRTLDEARALLPLAEGPGRG